MWIRIRRQKTQAEYMNRHSVYTMCIQISCTDAKAEYIYMTHKLVYKQKMYTEYLYNYGSWNISRGHNGFIKKMYIYRTHEQIRGQKRKQNILTNTDTDTWTENTFYFHYYYYFYSHTLGCIRTTPQTQIIVYLYFNT